MMTNILVISFISLFNVILIIYFSKIKFFHLNIDKPDNIRKIHKKPVALAGGTLIFLNMLIFWLLINFHNELLENEVLFKNNNSFNSFILISCSIFLLGFFDDKLNISANKKFLVSTIIILILIYIDPGILLNNIKFSFYEKNFILNNYKVFFSVFCFLVFLNAFNMFDGINLQSSSYSIFIFLCISIFFIDTLLIKILLISLISFSYLNYKNKAFLGDSGSLLIAFIISYVFIKLYNLGFIDHADKVVIYMIIPGLDLMRLFIIRILKKRNPLSPDKLHLHHILISKFSQNKSLGIILSLISLPIILNFFDISSLFTIVITVILYFTLLIMVKITK